MMEVININDSCPLSSALTDQELLPFSDNTVVELNMSRRLPVILLVETSEAMSEYNNLVTRSVKTLYDTILEDRTSCNMAELGVIAFNDKLQILEPLREIKKHSAAGRDLEFNYSTSALTGLALKAAITHLANRLKVYKNHRPRIRYCAPVVFLISCGVNQCHDDTVKADEEAAMSYVKNYMNREVSANGMMVTTAWVGTGCKKTLLRELTGREDFGHDIQLSEDGLKNEWRRIMAFLFRPRRIHPDGTVK